MSPESITVLFVDDDEQWANFIADEITDEAPAFTVRVALTANEAVCTLTEDHSIDCVVTDFRMPEIDGIQMLEHVQASHPHLPIILVTGDGNEAVAARAINAGVTDYIRKDPRVDQTPIFVNRIRQAVERARLRAEIRESEHRYRTVIEQNRDAILVIQEGEIVFANDRFHELCESGGALEDPQALHSYVHEDDHDHLHDILGATRAGTDPGLRSIRLVRPTGEVRHCELLGDAITDENEFATLLSIRDVTRRRSRERALRRAREFNQAVQKRLVSVRTREEFETEIADLLVADGYHLAWIGTVDRSGVRTRAAAGECEYLTHLEEGPPDGDAGADPVRWSAQTEDAQVVPDFETLIPTERRNDALQCGLRTGFAHPLRHEGLSYGVLAVYHDEPHYIDEAERSLLAEVAETVSFGIHHVETRQTLTSQAGIVVEVDIESDDYYLPRLLAERVDHSDITVTVDGTQVVDGGAQVQYLSCASGDIDGFANALDAHPAIRTRRVVDDGEPAIYAVVVERDTPETHLGSLGALVRSTTVTPGRATITFELTSREYLQPAMDRLNEHFGPVTIRSLLEGRPKQMSDGSARIDVDSLTEKQFVALEAAYGQGYFDRPRRNNAVDIAESLGITHTTYLQHLRVAQEKLFRQLFRGGAESANGRDPRG